MKILSEKRSVLTYTVDKDFYNTNLSISVENGEVVVCAPWYFTRNQIQKIVDEKREWILNKIKNYDKKLENKKEIRTTNILGKEYNININFKNIKRPELNLNNEEIFINFPLQYKKRNIDNILEIVLRKMYITISENKIEEIMEKTRIKLGFAPEEYIIKKMDNKLAICLDMNRIIINPEIMKFEQRIIEFIVMHEFCHLKYKTHSKGFEKIMKDNIFQYEKLKKEIENEGYVY